MAQVDLPVANTVWSLEVRDGTRIPLEFPGSSPVDPRIAVLNALEKPLRFEPFRRALTPDDRIAIVVDESLPHLSELITGILEYLAGVGIGPAAVTAISPAASSQNWLHTLPDSLAELQIEIHNPDDRNKLSYLAASRQGHRVYLNRTLVDADQSIILSGCGYDPQQGRSGGFASIYPALADTASIRSQVMRVSPQTDPDAAWPLGEDAREIAWLLGSPFFVHVLEGSGDVVQGVSSGLADTVADSRAVWNRAWKTQVEETADLVVVSLSGDPERHDFGSLARAAACGARVARDGGTVVVLSEADPELSEATEVLRRNDDVADAVKAILREKPADAAAAVQWCWAAGRTRLHLASEVRPSTIEEMFATPISSPREVQRLLDQAGRCLVIPDAHKRWIHLAGN